MSDPVDIFTRQPRTTRVDSAEGVDNAIVEILEQLLQRAKSGEITGFVFVGGTNCESTVTAYTKSVFNDPYMFCGRLDAFKHELLMDYYEGLYGPIAHIKNEEDEE